VGAGEAVATASVNRKGLVYREAKGFHPLSQKARLDCVTFMMFSTILYFTMLCPARQSSSTFSTPHTAYRTLRCRLRLLCGKCLDLFLKLRNLRK